MQRMHPDDPLRPLVDEVLFRGRNVPDEALESMTAECDRLRAQVAEKEAEAQKRFTIQAFVEAQNVELREERDRFGKELNAAKARVKELEAQADQRMEHCAEIACGLMFAWLSQNVYDGHSGAFPTTKFFLDAFTKGA